MKKQNNNKIPSNKNFGIVFFLVFLVISFFPLINNQNIIIWSLVISIFFLVLGLLNSKFLTPLNMIWFRFGLLLGNFVSPVIMGVVFFIVVTPTSFIMKILGKNLLNLKKEKKKTYWIERPKIKTTMRNQF